MIQLPSNIENPWFVILIISLLVIQLALVARYVYWQILSKTWTTVKAQIMSCEFKKASLKDETVDTIKISYAYEIQGEKFINSKISISDYACSWLVSPSKKIIRKIYLNSKSNSQLTIHVSQGNPNLSVINAEFDFRVIYFSIMFSFFLIFLLLESVGVYKFNF